MLGWSWSWLPNRVNSGIRLLSMIQLSKCVSHKLNPVRCHVSIDLCWFRRGVHKQEIVSLLGFQFVQNNSEFDCTALHGATNPCIKTSEKFVAQGQVDSLDLEPRTDLACLACNLTFNT